MNLGGGVGRGGDRRWLWVVPAKGQSGRVVMRSRYVAVAARRGRF